MEVERDSVHSKRSSNSGRSSKKDKSRKKRLLGEELHTETIVERQADEEMGLLEKQPTMMEGGHRDRSILKKVRYEGGKKKKRDESLNADDQVELDFEEKALDLI